VRDEAAIRSARETAWAAAYRAPGPGSQRHLMALANALSWVLEEVEPDFELMVAQAAQLPETPAPAPQQSQRPDDADPTGWGDVREALLRLRRDQPDVLMGYTNPHASSPPDPPFSIDLEANGGSVAADLHRRFGDLVRLRVGALPFPPGSTSRAPSPSRSVLDAREIEGVSVQLETPLTVISGRTVNRGVLIANESHVPLVIHTNGQLNGLIVDPVTGRQVGGFAGAQTLPLVRFAADPGESIRVPLLVGTASFDPDLGYTVPAGTWFVTAEMRLADGSHRRLPLLPLEITGPGS
jgi:hypothetical protein